MNVTSMRIRLPSRHPGKCWMQRGLPIISIGLRGGKSRWTC